VAEILIAVFDDARVKKFLANLDSNLKEIRVVKREFASLLSIYVYKDIMKHFEDQAGPNGPWQAWSTRYGIWRKGHANRGRRKGNTLGDGKILALSGRLRNAFTPAKFRSENDSIVWFNQATTAGGKPYAYFHDEGQGGMPKRQFMWLSDDALANIETVTLAYLLGKDKV